MKLIEDARRVAARAWSVRLALLSAVFGTLELALPYLGAFVPGKLMALLAIATGVGSAVARLVDQPKMRGRRG